MHRICRIGTYFALALAALPAPAQELSLAEAQRRLVATAPVDGSFVSPARRDLAARVGAAHAVDDATHRRIRVAISGAGSEARRWPIGRTAVGPSAAQLPTLAVD